MASPFARHFKQQDLSDVDLIIQFRSQKTDDERPSKRTRRSAEAAEAEAPSTTMEQLACLPGHRVILFTSEYFEAQGRHWQPQPASSSSLVPAGRNTLHLTIDTTEQLHAAEAVIAAMYGVSDAMGKLEQQQLIDVVVIADMLQAAAATQQAETALREAAQSDHGLAEATLEALAGVPAWPACLLQLLPVIAEHAPCCKLQAGADLAAIVAADSNNRVQRLLVAALGDLEAVWADPQLKTLLLGLPLPAMQLLLSSGQLCVVAEDTVLYTAQQFVLGQRPTERKAAAKAALAQLVRAPRLSHFALSWAALSEADGNLLLSAYSSQLRSLLSAKLAASAKHLKVATRFRGVPAAWKLPPRQIRPLEWRLPVEQLKQACRDSFAQQKTGYIISPECSPPLGGLTWRMWVSPRQREGGTVVDLLAGPRGLSPDMHYVMDASVGWEGSEWAIAPRCLIGHAADGPGNPFGLAPMTAGGWDEAAWAAAGLPTSGELRLWLHVRSVS